jgi:leucine efflux protein
VYPKAIRFFIFLFIQFVDSSSRHTWLSFCLLGPIVQLFSALYQSALTLGGAHLAVRFSALAIGGGWWNVHQL